MCGIWACIRGNYSKEQHADLLAAGVHHIEARGPEGTRFLDLSGGHTWAFARLAINGLGDEGMQPFNWSEGRWAWMCNGEIYNHADLEARIPYAAASDSDCEVLGALMESCSNDPIAFARALDGVFALVHYSRDTGITTVARDPYGVRPLFWGTQGPAIYFASERKALQPFVSATYVFPPGEVWTINGDTILRNVYHTVPWIKQPVGSDPAELVRTTLDAAITKRLMTERPVAALLSGGLDSSLIAALVQKKLVALGKPALKTFSIGMEGSSDLKYARMVADHIQSDHTEVLVTAGQMFDAIPQVIRTIESYDITTVRASVGNWLVGKAIREQTECKVVFNGDGSDEVWGSYLYFYKAPTDDAFEMEVERLLKEIYLYDVLRSDRCISSHGLEPRTPYLDKQFVAAALSVPTSLRRPGPKQCEKWLMRKAFDDGLLPSEVLWRRKEAFSDGVSSTEKAWFQVIQDMIVERGLVPEGWEEESKEWKPRPLTPEGYLYRRIFNDAYHKTGELWPYWMPRWSPETTDPSARTLALPE